MIEWPYKESLLKTMTRRRIEKKKNEMGYTVIAQNEYMHTKNSQKK